MNTAVLENLAGRLIDGRFSLLEWLGSTGNDAIYRTEVPGPQTLAAAIRLVPADAQTAAEQLDQWRLASGLSHPNLTRIYDRGRVQLDELDLLYVVTELPEEALDQILPERALTPSETAEMLPAVLDALEYLHSTGIVHGHLHPASILVVCDQLKLSSDSLERAGAMPGPQFVRTKYDAPELKDGAFSPASDVWSLGLVVIEALTREVPVTDASEESAPAIPEGVAQPFIDIARACLQLDPAKRCNVADLRAMLNPPPAAQAEPVAVEPAAAEPAAAEPAAAEPAAAEPAAAMLAAAIPTAAIPTAPIPPIPVAPEPAPVSAAEPQPPVADALPSQRPMRTFEDSPKPASAETKLPWLIGVAVVVLLLIVGFWVYAHRSQAGPSPETPAREAATPPASQPATHPAHNVEKRLLKAQVASRVMPDIPASAYRSIRGKVDPRIRVSVNRDGEVTGASIESEGHSRYFARKALEASRQWKFRPAQVNGHAESSVWRLQFEFQKNRASVTPTEVTP